MKRSIISILVLGFFAFTTIGNLAVAQENTYQSVLGQHTWYRLSVVKEGIYKLDYATLQSMGVDMSTLNPDQIRLFGNPSGALPEKNQDPRPDDLTEMAICVIGAEDGTFDEGDMVLFYGQEPTRWKLVDSGNETYRRERNYYSDTTFYYLCADSGAEGLRVGEKASLPMENVTTVITEFPDFFWHEEELINPYSIGLNWFGEMLNSEMPELSIPFSFPNLVKNKALLLKSRVLGRVENGSMHYNAWVSDNHVANNYSIPYHGEHFYGKLSTLEKQIMLDSDTASFRLCLNLNSDASLYLDYVEVYGWRQLKREGKMFPFRLMPSQFGNGVSAVWVKNTDGQYWLWDVTNPLDPMRQNGVLSADNLVFATDEAVEKRYIMFKPSAALEVEHWVTVPNQNLHAIADADMLIITLPIFWEQAQTLADYHRELDGLNSVVVDANQIYNEFSTGTPDPSGIRDFVRMVYHRSAGNLKYLTLFGRASYDFRNIKVVEQNFLPCYEEKNESHHETSFCTDDFFGLMDDDEGNNSQGYVDIGIGRLSVSTVEEAEVVLDKIRHYDDLAAVRGEWKTDILFFSDDEKQDYIDNNETYFRMLDTICPPLTAKKLYCGAYPVVNTSSGVEIPEANAELMRRWDKGMLALFYTGHGGVRGLTGDNVFTNSDIAVLKNYDKMPFVFTATCEFTKYDNPLLVSAGEQLFLNPNGGSVAMLTTCRPTYGPQNFKMGKALMKAIAQRDANGKPLRFGDIVRMAKSDPVNFTHPMVTDNVRFLFLGDPAMRFALPRQNIAVKRINGMDPEISEVELHAMSMVAMEGEVQKANGTVDTQFNGELWVRFYDKKSKIKVYTTSESTNVYYYKNELYQGKVSVNGGKFNVSFQVPKDIMLESGAARFSFYAYDSIRRIDAMGKYDGVTLGGVDPSMMVDDEGPRIDFYWNSPDFVSGSSVGRQGVLYADLYDSQGIYHYDYSLGRDIMMSSNHSAFNSLVLNDRYEPTLNDFRRGRLTIPVSDLEPGTYEFNLKVWDTQDNASEANLWFVVEEGSNVYLSQVRNYPNPFTDETNITLTHFGEDGNFDVRLEIFDMLGRNVYNFSKAVTFMNGATESIRWDGCDQFGNLLKRGIYLYRLTMTDETGYSCTVSQKMVIDR